MTYQELPQFLIDRFVKKHGLGVKVRCNITLLGKTQSSGLVAEVRPLSLTPCFLYRILDLHSCRSNGRRVIVVEKG